MMKIISVIICTMLLVGVWYLFIKPYEYEVKITARTLPGDIIETIRIWDRSLENAEIVEVDSFFKVKQNFILNNRNYIYNWHFNLINDSTTDINIKISQPDRKFKNKLLIPFSTQPIEQDAKDIMSKFYDLLKTHLHITKVSVIGESEIDPVFCVCRSLETKQIEKAYGMMKDYGLLTTYVSDNSLQVTGPPIVKIRKWNHSLGELTFDFCFPIEKKDSLPKHSLVSYKEFNKMKVLKAIYNGNYITSDRAWYALIRHAEINGYIRNGNPIEYFYNNPNLGMNEKDWKAEVYLPIK